MRVAGAIPDVKEKSGLDDVYRSCSCWQLLPVTPLERTERSLRSPPDQRIVQGV